ncbi:MAG: FKBP-type peptidyl-prolyl cis-trans isomerase [Caulobacter sp.]|nr:FKBP-type peptidyl-prolyl cis-trans isomerase [Caulobacter sp.]
MRRIATVLLAAVAALSLAACDGGKAARKNLLEGTEFLAENAKAEGVTTLPDGVQRRIIQSGPTSGLKPRRGDELKVHYEGKLLNGEVFDSSYERGSPMTMELNGLIKAWMDVLPMMRPGDTWVLYVPPDQGYGKDGSGSIPPNAVLVFRIELIDVLPSGRNAARG